MNQQETIAKAKAALKDNPFGNFDAQAPHLTYLMNHLPIFEINDPSIQLAFTSGGQQMSFKSVLDRLKENWMAQHPPASHDGAIELEVGPETDRLVINFSLFLWGQSNVVRRLEVARIGADTFVFRDVRQPALPQTIGPGRSKVDAMEEKSGWLAWFKGLKRS